MFLYVNNRTVLEPVNNFDYFGLPGLGGCGVLGRRKSKSTIKNQEQTRKHKKN